MMDQGTVREDGSATIREGYGSVTVREGAPAAKPAAPVFFRGYLLKRQLPSKGTEADIYIVEREGVQYVLKLYRYGIEPKGDILQKMKFLSQAHPAEFIRIFEADFDAGSKRWFEVQEYAQHGTLQALMDERAKFPDADRTPFFSDVAREVGQSLHILHQNNLLHLDMKPSNILLRSLIPLDLVLIDFGISTSLLSDMSKKFTQMRGTPMYQSPESWTGGMGRASDWWGLGMILLEIAARAHPFRGLSNNIIAYAIATQPIDIPETLEEGQKELLRGLLTRDPDRRWNWDQVSRWLEGERNIPQFFGEIPQTNQTAQTAQVTDLRTAAGIRAAPFAFMGQQCRTLSEIAGAFVRDEESWEKGRALLLRGSVRVWLEQNGEFEGGEDLERALAGVADPDEKMLRFTQQYGRNIPFVLCGHQITLQSLLLVAAKSVKRSPLTAAEQKTMEWSFDGRLLACLAQCLLSKQGVVTAELLTLRAALERIRGHPQTDAAAFLDFFLEPQRYYCPFLSGAIAPGEVINASSGLTLPPWPMEAWSRLAGQYVLPQELVAQTFDVKTYGQALARISRMEREKHLLLRASCSPDEERALAQAPMQGYLDGVYRLQWGYDAGSIARICSARVNVGRLAEDAEGLKRARLDLAAAYLAELAEKRVPLSLEDRRILQELDAGIKSGAGIAEGVASRVQGRMTALAEALEFSHLAPAVRRYKSALAEDERAAEARRQRRRKLRRRLSKLFVRVAAAASAIVGLLYAAPYLSGDAAGPLGSAWDAAVGWCRSMWGLASAKLGSLSDLKSMLIMGSAFLAILTRQRFAWAMLAVAVLYKFLG